MIYVDEALGVEAKMKQDKKTGFAKPKNWESMCCCNLVIGGTFVSLRKLVLGMAKKLLRLCMGQVSGSGQRRQRMKHKLWRVHGPHPSQPGGHPCFPLQSKHQTPVFYRPCPPVSVRKLPPQSVDLGDFSLSKFPCKQSLNRTTVVITHATHTRTDVEQVVESPQHSTFLCSTRWIGRACFNSFIKSTKPTHQPPRKTCDR